MTRYWLVPVPCREPLTLGRERFLCPDGHVQELLIAAAGAARPRLLTPFKAHLLLAGEKEDVCGANRVWLSLECAGDIVFDGSPMQASDCAAAMLDRLSERLPHAQAALAALHAELRSIGAPESAFRALAKLQQWLNRGWIVLWLKEEAGT